MKILKGERQRQRQRQRQTETDRDRDRGGRERETCFEEFNMDCRPRSIRLYRNSLRWGASDI